MYYWKILYEFVRLITLYLLTFKSIIFQYSEVLAVHKKRENGKSQENLNFFFKTFQMTKINNFIYIWIAFGVLCSNLKTVLYYM